MCIVYIIIVYYLVVKQAMHLRKQSEFSNWFSLKNLRTNADLDAYEKIIQNNIMFLGVKKMKIVVLSKTLTGSR